MKFKKLFLSLVIIALLLVTGVPSLVTTAAREQNIGSSQPNPNAPIITTAYKAMVWGSGIAMGKPIPVGSKVQVNDANGTTCGEVTLTKAGEYSIVVYGDDPKTSSDEGARFGDHLVFWVTNPKGTQTVHVKTIPSKVIWEDGLSMRVDLEYEPELWKTEYINTINDKIQRLKSRISNYDLWVQVINDPMKLQQLKDNLQDNAELRQKLEDDIVLIKKILRLIEKRDKVQAGELSVGGTTYYIDLDNGNDANDGLSTANPWLTIGKYTTVTVRSAGDIAWVRANTDQVMGAANVAFDEDGTVNNYIEIRGCSATAGEDPWGDGSNVKPIFNFNGGAYYFNPNTDDFWRLYRMDVKNGSSASGLICVDMSHGIIIDSCYIHQATSSTAKTLYLSQANGVIVRNCQFDDNRYVSISLFASEARIENTTFDGGGTYSTDYGLFFSSGVAEVSDCKFGETATHDLADIYIGTYFGKGYLRNCKLASSTEVSMAGKSIFSFVCSEDHDQVKGAQKSYYYTGTVERDSSIQIDSLDSAKMSPNANCGSWQALNLSNSPLDGDYQIWCPASATTITIKARCTAAWTTNPTATEFYFEAWYLDQVSGGRRAIQKSSQALSGITEVSFTMTFTPAQAGWVYVRCYLKKYEAGKSVNVSVKPTIS